MPKHPFSVFLTRKFLEWQLEEGEPRSQAEFANLIGVKRTSLTMWMNGDHLPGGENVTKLANFLGPEVYDLLGLERPNPDLQAIIARWDRLSPEQQRRLAQDSARYEAENYGKDITRKAPKQGKEKPGH